MKKAFFVIGFCLFGVGMTKSFGQSLNADGTSYKIGYNGSFTDRAIPGTANLNGYNFLSFTIKGADGGAYRGVFNKKKGGGGATVRASFEIGTGAGQLQPGGTVRFVVGNRGQNDISNGVEGGGGGGGTGILYKHPSATITCSQPSTDLADANSCWVILAVAGGGGGAFASDIAGTGTKGKGGNDGECGKDGKGIGGGNGGCNGNGGKEGEDGVSIATGGGGGAFSDGDTPTRGGKKGGFTGGDGGEIPPGKNGAEGGFGYGGGGSGSFASYLGGLSGGGGGGGYSGGGGAYTNPGGGGGSFANLAAIAVDKEEGGADQTPDRGEASYLFNETNPSGMDIKCKDISITLSGGSYTLTPSEIDNGSTAEPDETISLFIGKNLTVGGITFLIPATDITFDCNSIGDMNVILWAQSSSGQQGACTAIVEVMDDVDPVVNCTPVTITGSLDANGEYTLPISAIESSSSDACGNIVDKFLSQKDFTCTDIGLQTITLVVTDNSGNSSDCTASLNIDDLTAPTVTCADVTVELDAAGAGSVSVNDVASGSSDNCASPPSLSFTNGKTAYTCTDAGQSFNVTVTADDGNGNTTPCTANITVQDNIAPSPTCKNTTVQLGASGNYTLAENDVFGGGTDNCGIVNFQSMGQTAVDCTDEGTTVTVTVTANDGNENTATCTANITVEDNIAPSPTCKNTTVQLGASGNYTLAENDVFGGGTDNCGTVSYASSSPATVDCTDEGTTVSVTVTANDGNGNTATCTANITVEDNIDPVPNCINTTVQLNSNGNHTLLENDVLDGGTDNCGIVNFWYMSPTSVYCGDEGSVVPVTVHVFDANGNQAFCIANVTVEDATPPEPACLNPTVQLGPSGNLSLSENDVFNGGTDNCGVVNFVAMSPASVNCANAGTTVSVTVTANDGNGNEATCTTTVTVEDNTPPDAVCQDATVQLDASGNANITASDIDNGSSDACGIGTRELDVTAFGCSNVGPNTVTLTVTDNNDNVETCTATVTVEDNVLPEASCTTQTIQAVLDANAEYTIDPADLDDGSSDACGNLTLSADPAVLSCQHEGANTVTLTVTDGSGNGATCTATVDVAEFLTIDGVDVTGETCEGAGDGSITVNATAGGGQVGYSIDNGVNFQFTDTFTSLTPGSYDIIVKVFGLANICEKTTTATVAEGNAPTTWYKDNDADGYTDGTTFNGCTPPAGYVAAATPGDCNDNNADIHPGATEICDGLDNDCDGNVPAGEVDADGDGYMVCEGDCNDSDASVSPGAAEVCDGIDNDCDGDIDEGLSGETYTGSVTFSNQAQIDDWFACYSIIDGSLTIIGGDITDLGPLSGISEVTGSLSIYYNSSLASLDGLNNLTTVGGSLTMFYNFALGDCCALYALLNNGGVSGGITIFFNKAGCNSQSEILSECSGSNLVAAPKSGILGAEMLERGKIKKAATTLQVSLFPNPVNGQFSIVAKGTTGKRATLRITDNMGRVVYLQTVEEMTEAPLRVNATDLAPGLYSLTVKAEGLPVATKRFVKIQD